MTQEDVTAINGADSFQGRRLDSETGLYYFRNRYYSPTLGRFLQRDPAGYVDGMNLYEFVGGRPIVAVDPSGQDFSDTYAESIAPMIPFVGTAQNIIVPVLETYHMYYADCGVTAKDCCRQKTDPYGLDSIEDPESKCIKCVADRFEMAMIRLGFLTGPHAGIDVAINVALKNTTRANPLFIWDAGIDTAVSIVRVGQIMSASDKAVSLFCECDKLNLPGKRRQQRIKRLRDDPVYRQRDFEGWKSALRSKIYELASEIESDFTAAGLIK